LQANRTAVLVHRLLSKTRDPDIKEEVRNLLLQRIVGEDTYEFISFNIRIGIKREEENYINNCITI
jgi:hypothetical protein